MALKQETKEAIKANRKLFMSDVPNWQKFFETISPPANRGVISTDLIENTSLGLGDFMNYMVDLPDAMFMQTSLEEIVVPENIDEIGVGCFLGGSNLKKVTLLGNIKTIPKQCFASCTSLEEIHLPDSIRRIDLGAFDGVNQNVKIFKKKTGQPIKASAAEIPFIRKHFVEEESAE